jgi:2-C-methyl-D-erythritol 4-phosphate cytidylyltransferase
MAVAAIVLAGGAGSRVRKNVNKVYLPVRDRDILAYSLETLGRSPRIARVVLVVREEDRGHAEFLAVETIASKPSNVVIGGPSRHLSELAGIRALADLIESGAIEIVAIHDGARPFLTHDLLNRLLDAAVSHGGAIPGLPIEAPLYRATSEGLRLLPSQDLRRVQTPQVFHARVLLEAYQASVAAGFEGVDTAETVERFSDLEVKVIPGDPRNIKITFVEDLFVAEEYALDWEKGGWVTSP